MGYVFTCPACGWTVVTPKGESDLVEGAMWHGGRSHPGMPMTREEILKMSKSV
jgi:hypothetical protein